MAITQECWEQYWTSPGGNTPQGTSYTATCLPSRKLQVRRTRPAGHCWRCRDELINDVLLWTSKYGREKAGRPERIYIQQLCEDTGRSPEDLPESMNDREKWRERVRDIRASGTTWRGSLYECQSKSNTFFFNTEIITDTGACIIHETESGPMAIPSPLLNIVTVSLSSNVLPSNQRMFPCLVKFYWLFFLVDFLPKEETNTEAYIEALTRLKSRIQQVRPSLPIDNILLLHDYTQASGQGRR